jgi:hypothetical protein
VDLFEVEAVHVSDCGKEVFPACVAKATSVDVTTVRVVAVAASVLCVGAPHDHFNSDVDILIQVLSVRHLPHIEFTTVALSPLAVDVQSVAWQAGQ